MTAPALYRDICENMSKELLVSQEMVNMINLTDVDSSTDELVITKMMKYLKDIGRASLSEKLWDATKTKLDVDILSMKRESCDIEMTLTYEDWKSFIKQGIIDSGLEKIGNAPAIQASHKMFQGVQLMDSDNTRGKSAYPLNPQYNFITDVGANSLASTILRPIGCNQVTGTPNTWTATAGAWSTYANMATDINQIETLFAQGFNRDTTYVFYPQIASPAMGKKRTVTGVGYKNAFQELEDHGIPKERIIETPNAYMYTAAGATPTNALFDLYFIDMKSIKTHLPVSPFVNSYVANEQAKFPELVVEAGLTMIQHFKPKYGEDGKWRKGVAIVRAIVGT